MDGPRDLLLVARGAVVSVAFVSPPFVARLSQEGTPGTPMAALHRLFARHLGTRAHSPCAVALPTADVRRVLGDPRASQVADS